MHEDAHLVTWSSNSEEYHFFNAYQNNFHLALIQTINIIALPGGVPNEVCTYCYY